MQTRRYVWLLTLLLGLAACSGGSGSSGFDAAPSENAAITLALQEQRCVDSPTLTVCPTNVTSTQGNPHQPVEVRTSIDQQASLACASTALGVPCNFTVPFSPEGFPPDTTFRVAVRRTDPLGPWVLAAPPLPDGAPDAAGLEVPVALPSSTDAPAAGAHVQVAVLVFAEPPQALPTTVPELSDTGADSAFVTHELTLQVTTVAAG